MYGAALFLPSLPPPSQPPPFPPTCRMPVAPNTPAAAPAKMDINPRTCSTAWALCVRAGKDNWERLARSADSALGVGAAIWACIIVGSIMIALLVPAGAGARSRTRQSCLGGRGKEKDGVA